MQPAARQSRRVDLTRINRFLVVLLVGLLATIAVLPRPARATLSALEIDNLLLEMWFADEITYSTLYWEYIGIRPSIGELKTRKDIYRTGHPFSWLESSLAVNPTSYTLASATPSLPFLGNQMLVSDQPTPDGTAFASAALRRNADCTLTETVFEPVNDRFDPTSYLELPGAQNFFHMVSGLATTSNVFAHGCVESSLGKRSVGTSLPVGTGGTNVAVVARINASSEQLEITALNAVTHATTTTALTSGRVRNIVVADLDGDGLNDIVASGVGYGVGNSGNVVVYLNNGNGTFRTAATVANGGSTMVLDDLNGDGKIDLVIDNGYDANNVQAPGVTTMLGNGDGTFRAAVVSATSVTQVYGPFVTGDFDGDGKVDLLLGTQVLLGRGDGTFVAGPAFPSAVQGVIGFNAAVGDVNGDGKLDVVTSGSLGGLVQVLLGNGDGTFTLGARYASLPLSQAVTVTDLDGDGNLDIVVGTASQGLFLKDRDDPLVRQIQYLLGRGDGTFVGAPVVGGAYAQNSSASQMAVADFDGDGKLDVVFADAAAARTLVLLPGTGTSRFGTPIRIAVSPLSMVIASADLNGDGKPDAIVAGYSAAGVPQVAVLTNQGGGRFSERDYGLPTFPASMAVGDFDGDGRPDLAVGTGTNVYANTGPSGVYVFYGQPDGSLSAPVRVDASVLPGSIAAADTNGDGRSDLVVADFGTTAGTRTLRTYLGNADRTFTAGAALPATTANDYSIVAFGDIDGDGKQDLLVGASVPGASFGVSTSNLYTYLGKGDGTFQAPLVEQLDGDNGSPNAIAIADLNHDGHLDVAIGGQSDFTEVLTGIGDGTYVHALMALAQQPSTIVAADLNNDRFPELLVGVAGVGTIVFKNAGTSDAWASSSSSPTPPVTPTSGDFTFTATPTSASIVAGQSTQTLVAAMPASTDAQTVTLSCSGLPAGATCVFSPTSLSLANGAAASSSLTIRTAATAVASLRFGDGGGVPGGLFIATLGGAGVVARRRKWRLPKTLGLLGIVGVLSSCGGDNGSAGPQPVGSAPVGTTYNVTITAAGTSNTHTASFMLTVH